MQAFSVHSISFLLCLLFACGCSTHRESTPAPLKQHGSGRESTAAESAEQMATVHETPMVVMVVPCANGYEYAMHNYDFNPVIERALSTYEQIEVLPFPFKKMIGVPYQGVFDKKYCLPIIEKVDTDYLLLTRFTDKLHTIGTPEAHWGYEVRIVQTKTMKQIQSIRANNLASYKDLERHIQDNIGVLKSDMESLR